MRSYTSFISAWPSYGPSSFRPPSWLVRIGGCEWSLIAANQHSVARRRNRVDAERSWSGALGLPSLAMRPLDESTVPGPVVADDCPKSHPERERAKIDTIRTMLTRASKPLQPGIDARRYDDK